MIRARAFAGVFFLAAAVGCSSSKPAAPVPAPVAAIAPLSGGVEIGQTVQLDGTGSKDPQNRAIGFGWDLVVRPAGSGALLVGADTSTPTLVPDVVGNYQVRLVVMNSVGVASAPAYLNIAAATCGALQLGTPVVSVSSILDPQAGALSGNDRPNVGSRVTLAAAANDPNVACGGLVSPNRYQWSLLSAPAGSQASLASSTDPAPSFVPDVQGRYELAVTVTDALGNASAAPGILDVDTTTCGANRPTVAINPMAVSLNSYQSFALAAAASTLATDAGSTQACPARFGGQTYATTWTISGTPLGGHATLTPTTGASATFVATAPGVYQVHASVTDSKGLTSDPAASSSFTTITVGACGSAPPVISATALVDTLSGAPVSNPAVGAPVTLVVNAFDPDATCGGGAIGQIVSYALDAVSLPSGSTAPTSVRGTSASFPFTPDVFGTWIYDVTVTDDSGLTATARVTITTAACAPVVPSITSLPGSATTTSLVTLLSGPVTDVCVKQPVLSYAWSLAQRPAGSQSVIGGSGATAAMVPDVAGFYVVRLVVTDNTGLSSAPQTLTLPVGNCASSVPIVGPLAATPSVPDEGMLVALSAPFISDPNSGTCAASVTPYQYRWTQISSPPGSTAQLDSPTSATPRFVADLPNATWRFSLTITDALGATSAPALLSVTSSSCGAHPPTVSLVPGLGLPDYSVIQSVTVNGGATLFLSRSSNPANNFASGAGTLLVPLYPGEPAQLAANVLPGADACAPAKTVSFRWSIRSAPVGSTAQLTNPTAATPGFTPDVPGNYAFELVLTDQNGFSSTTVLGVPGVAQVGFCGTSAPVLAAGVTGPIPSSVSGSATEPVAMRTLLDASGSFSPDAAAYPLGCGLSRPLGFQWTIASVPPGSTAQITSPTLVDPSFVPDLPGPYVLNVTTTDGAHSASKTLTVNAVAAHSSTPAVTGASFTATAVDASGNPVVAWWDNSTGTVAAARCTANCATSNPTWTSLGTIDSGLGAPLTFAPVDEPRPIAIAVDGPNVWVAYFTSFGAGPTTGAHGLDTCSVALARNDGTGWVSVTSLHAGSNACTAGGAAPYTNVEVGRWLSMGIRNSFPVVSFWSVVGTTMTDLELRQCFDANCASSNLAVVDPATSATTRLGRWSSLGVDQAGVIGIAYYVDDDGTGRSGLKFAHDASGAFAPTPLEISATVDVGRFASLAANANGALGTPAMAIAYRDETNKVARLARLTGNGSGYVFSSVVEILDAASNDYGRHTALAVDPNTGFLRLAYLDAQNGVLRVLAAKDGISAPGFATIAALNATPPAANTPLGLSMTFGSGTDLSFSPATAPIRFFMGP